MRTCVMPSTDLSHLSRAQPALKITLCSLLHPASAGVVGRDPFELPRELWVFPTSPFHTCSFGSPSKNWNKDVSCQDGAEVSCGFWGELWYLGQHCCQHRFNHP